MSTHALRPYQTEIVRSVEAQWAAGNRNVLAVLPTGAGKTVTFATVVERRGTPSVCIAHRAELVQQMSLALAREGVRHRVIGPDTLRRSCVEAHMDDLGQNFLSPTSLSAVAGVDTLVRMPASDPLFASVGLWVTDEAHHLVSDNKWGRAVALFPNAVGLGVTATPTRSDRKGLGRCADGVFDEMVVGPGMRELIDLGYLTDYEVACPPSDINLAQVHVSASGDYNPEELRQARRKSRITGDMVAHYLRHCRGKLGVAFDTDIASATETCQAFRNAGVPAEVLSGKTPADQRRSIIRRFKARQVHVLVSVDVISEGFDLPAIELVMFGRPTLSFSLYAQQLGRALRLMVGPELMARWEQLTPAQRKAAIAASSKPVARVHDHVGNFAHFGPPDRPRRWTLRGGESTPRSLVDDAIPMRICDNPTCNAPYLRAQLSCPHCDNTYTPAERSRPEHVDGDLVLLDAATLAQLRGEVQRIDGSPIVPFGAPSHVQMAVRNQWAERQAQQRGLRALMAIYGGWQKSMGRDEREAQRRFFFQFKVDVLTAQTYGSADAEKLAEEVLSHLLQNGIAV